MPKAAQKIRKLLPLAACMALLCGCSQPPAPADRAAARQELLAGNSADPETLDPSLATGLSEAKILRALFEGLVRADSATLEIKPAAAKSWSVSDGGMKYVFKLDERAKWSDGEPLKASDFVFAWRRALSPKIASEYSSLLLHIKNAEKIRSGAEPDSTKLGARALDGRTLVVELEKPCPYFLSLLYHNVFFPLPEKTLRKLGAAELPNAVWTKPQHMVSNGAFKLESWQINNKVRVVKNPHFREAAAVRLNAIEFLPISNINTEDRAFRAGQLHVTDSAPAHRIDAIRKNSPQTLRADKWLGVYYYVFNTRAKPFDNPKVRRALSLAIDRDAIIRNFLKAGQTPAYSLVPDGCGGMKTSPDIPQKGNAALAKKLLAEAGYPGGRGFPEVRITYNASELHKPIAEAIQQMWLETLGVRASLYNMSWPAYLAARRAGDFQIARASWVGDFAEPETFLEMFSKESSINHSGWTDENFDALLRAAKSAKTTPQRLALLSRAEKLLMDGAPVMPVYFYSRVYQILPLVKNWHPNLLDYRDYRDVYLQP